MTRAPIPALLAAPVLAFLGACATTEPSLPWGDPAGEVADPALAQLCRDGWEDHLSWNPISATNLGDPRHHGQLVVPSPETRDRRRADVLALLQRAEAIAPAGFTVENQRLELDGTVGEFSVRVDIEGATLTPSDRITLELLIERWAVQLADLSDPLELASWNLDPLEGPQGRFLTLAEDQPTETRRQQEQCLERWRLIPAYLDQVAANLERGVASGRVASWTATRKVLDQLDTLLATPPAESPLVTAVSASRSRTFRREVQAVVEDDIYPAFARLRNVITERVLPNARDDDHAGIAHVPGGREYYRLCARRETSLDLSPEEIHAIGLAEVERIRREIADLGERVFRTRKVAEIQRRLRTDPALHFSNRAEVEAAARRSFERASAAVPAAFNLLPRAPCEIVRVPAHEERDTTIAYYRSPSADGRRPGRYYINTYAPDTRPRYDAEVLAFHEAVPGHHTQIALAQELDGLPLLRRHGGSTAFVEGWALYTERLCDELGLYSGDLDRFGVLSFDAWRACRLVVDTGLHHYGWSRQRAIDYMVANTLLAENNVVNEVDRYIAWPGQALAYKLGQREILALRAEARAALGEDFDLKSFHDRVLENGAVTLSILRRLVEEWAASPAPAP